MNEVTIKVEGMSCGGCVANVTGVLKALSGVSEAQVSLADASATGASQTSHCAAPLQVVKSQFGYPTTLNSGRMLT